MKTYQAKFVTPFSVLGILTEENTLVGIDFLPLNTLPLAPQDEVSTAACEQIAIYLQDAGYCFNLPMSLRNATPHRMKVWESLKNIPSGSVLHYGELAKTLHSSPRAVGQACGANPVPIIIPCHRVLAKNGLGGFMSHSGGDPLQIKKWLLRHEGIQ
ncbi:methylated-DNA--[protein]-cysteine S-methyltransferase [Sulfurirhabdus autotrophica]|uniref:Methylated-DNA-[protein]-cysteine S-methyltransferase n=1 Tax=Sulfurirhabdus autotrophica TaxID=1706046 RepID=A0A4R3XV10_9PROT|nr:MGMT family protein [Sulfurirhabdus autotrophica]TCV82990.1 methylated-DNA-[protein]-cysteine S-methyltransferase [Sulfurirhabdus autotrophica]